MSTATPISIADSLARLTFLADRTPDTSDAESQDAFAMLCPYRDGGIFVGHYAGYSNWERHGVGDEMVYVVEGRTTLICLVQGREVANALGPGDLMVVPMGTWHRFETPDGVKIMTVTPQPTDHSKALPAADGPEGVVNAP